jgi:hypothetical protein
MWPRLNGSSASPRIFVMRPSSVSIAMPQIASHRLQARWWIAWVTA